ncbi:hypothetical protein [Aquimarina longa]|uniref:hypothetical protein n=1 Tax=Aquimarina longa TaxID=1080221 RepID=UPI000785B2A3|nr:hypothetical protein [Aquimarina longa]
MKLTRTILLLIIAAITIVACGQENKNNKASMKKRPIDKILELHKQKINYTSMPQYFIEGHQSGCYYEIYVNGFLVFNHYKNVGLANHAIPINSVILKSGTQRVTVKLFALGKIGDKEYPTLQSNTRFRLKIFKRDKATPWEGLDYDVVKEYFAPTTTGKDTGSFKNVGVPMFEETFTFEAEVPYELTGWSESEDLSNEEDLEKQVLLFFKNYSEIIQNIDEEKWVEMVFQSEKEQIHSTDYFGKEEVEKRVNEYKNTFDNEILEVQPLDKYKIILGAEGRVVSLKSIERKGKSAFSFIQNIDYNGRRVKSRSSRYLYLHKPKGSNKLEIIR